MNKQDVVKQSEIPMPVVRIIRLGFVLGLVGVVQYLVVTTVLMQYYPGGNIMDRGAESFSFLQNFMSDLGRTTNFGRQDNPTAPFYAATLAIAGICSALFFIALTSFFSYFTRAPVIYLCLLCGVLAGIGYVGIAMHPLNSAYRMHVTYVQMSFIAFWLMTVCCAYAIYRVPAFSNAIGHMLLLFACILGIQILIMLFGPRSWSAPAALLLQVTAQKVVVYSEILAMCVLSIGALRALGSMRR
jgi:hypothetical protein